jgi:hypothetical protein
MLNQPTGQGARINVHCFPLSSPLLSSQPHALMIGVISSSVSFL